MLDGHNRVSDWRSCFYIVDQQENVHHVAAKRAKALDLPGAYILISGGVKKKTNVTKTMQDVLFLIPN